MTETRLLSREKMELLAMALIAALLAWTVGYSLFVRDVRAASLTNVSDTLSDSDLGVGANHVLAYTNGTSTIAGQTIRVTFDPSTDAFGGFATLNFSAISFSGATLTAACSGAASEVTVATSTTAGAEGLVFTVCAGDTVASGAKVITVTSTSITNPVGSGSYVIRIAGTQENNADTRVAIIDDVVVTASVDTSFTFTIAGLATSTDVNGTSTTGNSSATALSFGTLAPGVHEFLAQELAVTTNARNGFVVTVKQDQNLLSQTGADIDLFQNGTAVAAPASWSAPSGTLDQEDTYGHYGVTSEDSDLNSDEFGTNLYAGNLNVSRQVFSHTGPADGSTADKGLTQIGYRVQITGLQEAATDYTNTLTYVATPTF